MSDKSVVVVVTTISIILPLTLLRKLDGLKYTSLLGLAGTLVCAAFMTLRYFDGSYRPNGVFYKLIKPEFRPRFGKNLNVTF
jgi:amino acid permease